VTKTPPIWSQIEAASPDSRKGDAGCRIVQRRGDERPTQAVMRLKSSRP
jgi:hypothetical protein